MTANKMKKVETIAIIQARMSSTRLPGKVLKPIAKLPSIIYQLQRVKKCKNIDNIIVATTDQSADDQLCKIISDHGYKVFRGHEDDVLNRFQKCVEQHPAEIVVRLTGDCPLIDPKLIDEIVEEYKSNNWDYLGNCADDNNLSVPDGFDVEVFCANLLKMANLRAKLSSEREHVTPWFRSKEADLKWSHYCHKPMRTYYRVTVDTAADYEVVNQIANILEEKISDYGVDDVVNYLDENPLFAAKNLCTIRIEGFLKSLELDKRLSGNTEGGNRTGQKLWSRAKKVIPGGNMLLSKRAEMFLPEEWPAYFKRAKGCRIWDLDDRELIDMSIMGIGTNVLGYGHPEVDSADPAATGNMSTKLPEEVWLAEKLIGLHPWADGALRKWWRSKCNSNTNS